jgi:hypothetical protein
MKNGWRDKNMLDFFETADYNKPNFITTYRR